MVHIYIDELFIILPVCVGMLTETLLLVVNSVCWFTVGVL